MKSERPDDLPPGVGAFRLQPVRRKRWPLFAKTFFGAALAAAFAALLAVAILGKLP